jgi:hypothetical protein
VYQQRAEEQAEQSIVSKPGSEQKQNVITERQLSEESSASQVANDISIYKLIHHNT